MSYPYLVLRCETSCLRVKSVEVQSSGWCEGCQRRKDWPEGRHASVQRKDYAPEQYSASDGAPGRMETVERLAGWVRVDLEPFLSATNQSPSHFVPVHDWDLSLALFTKDVNGQ